MVTAGGGAITGIGAAIAIVGGPVVVGVVELTLEDKLLDAVDALLTITELLTGECFWRDKSRSSSDLIETSQSSRLLCPQPLPLSSSLSFLCNTNFYTTT